MLTSSKEEAHQSCDFREGIDLFTQKPDGVTHNSEQIQQEVSVGLGSYNSQN